jgi:signal transduction histidine kinase
VDESAPDSLTLPEISHARDRAEVSAFLSAAIHELRTPLTSIRGFTDVLVKGADRLSATERADHLERIAAAAARLDRLIAELAAAAREL